MIFFLKRRKKGEREQPNLAIPPRQSFANLFTATHPNNPLPFTSSFPCHPGNYPLSLWINGKAALTIPQSMLTYRKDSFFNVVIGRFISRCPSLEWVEDKAKL